MKRVIAIAPLIGFINCILAIFIVFLTFNATEQQAQLWINPTLWVLAPVVIVSLIAALLSFFGPPFIIERIDLRWPRKRTFWQRKRS